MGTIDLNKATFVNFSMYDDFTITVAINGDVDVDMKKLQSAFDYAEATMNPDTDEEYVHYALERCKIRKCDYEIIGVNNVW